MSACPLVAAALLLGGCAHHTHPPVPEDLLDGDDPFALQAAITSAPADAPATRLATAVLLARRAAGPEGAAAIEAWLRAYPEQDVETRSIALHELGDAEGSLGRYQSASERFVAALALHTTGSEQEGSGSAAFWGALAGLPPPHHTGAPGASVPLQIDGAELLRARVELGGQSAALIVDTGAEVSVLRESIARAAGLRPIADDLHIETSTSAAQFDLYLAERINVHGCIVENVPFIVQPDSAMTFGGGVYAMEGILGLPVLRAIGRVAWTDRGSTLLLGSAAPAARDYAAPLFLHDDGLGLGIRLGATMTPFHLDTGANRTELSDRAVALLGLDAGSGLRDTLAIVEGLGGRETSKRRQLEKVTLEVGGAAVPLRHVNARPRAAGDPDGGTVGGDVLRELDSFLLDFDAMRYEARRAAAPNINP